MLNGVKSLSDSHRNVTPTASQVLSSIKARGISERVNWMATSHGLKPLSSEDLQNDRDSLAIVDPDELRLGLQNLIFRGYSN